MENSVGKKVGCLSSLLGTWRSCMTSHRYPSPNAGEGVKPCNPEYRQLLTLPWRVIILISMIDMTWLLHPYPFPSFLEASS